jgi:hypothetical protein
MERHSDNDEVSAAPLQVSHDQPQQIGQANPAKPQLSGDEADVRSSEGSGSLAYDDSSSDSSLSGSSEFWTHYLAGVAPCLFPATLDTSPEWSSCVEVDVSRLWRHCQTRHVDALPFLHAAWGVVLQGYTLTDDVVFGCRSEAGIKPCRVPRHGTFSDLVGRLAHETKIAPPHGVPSQLWNTLVETHVSSAEITDHPVDPSAETHVSSFLPCPC